MNNLFCLPNDLLTELKKKFEELNKALELLGQKDYTFDQYEIIFSKYGWFIPYEIRVKDVMDIVNQFEKGEIDKANEFLIKYFKKNLITVKEKLLRKHYGRVDILNEAFNAHKRKMYYSSTLLFLSQADGITENQIFIGNNFKKFKSNNAGHSLVQIFNQKNPLTVNFKKQSHKSIYFSELNRHGAMHGLSLDFGAVLNSYKALSLLWFVSNFRNKIENK